MFNMRMISISFRQRKTNKNRKLKRKLENINEIEEKKTFVTMKLANFSIFLLSRHGSTFSVIPAPVL